MNKDFNGWFCSLPEGRQAALRDEKWMLADIVPTKQDMLRLKLKLSI